MSVRTKSSPRVPSAVFLLYGATAITFLAFGLRMIGLVQVPARWDEGWSVAHASLSLGEIFTITSADVHPPLFYVLLGAWQSLTGVNLFADRALMVMMSLPAVPLIFVTARRWSGSTRLALAATVLMAWLPLVVYYSAVIRMYALAPSFVLLATWAALRTSSARARTQRKSLYTMLALVIGLTGAMLTLYHAAWALIALVAYVLIIAVIRNRRSLGSVLRPVVIGLGISLILYAPWAIYAFPQLIQRALAGTTNVGQGYPLLYFMSLGVQGLLLARSVGPAGLWITGALIMLGLISWAIGVRSRKTHLVSGVQPGMAQPALQQLALPVLTIVLTLVGVAAAARNWAFDDRMMVCAAPALALWLAWSFDAIAHQSRELAGVGVVALIGVYFSVSTSFVYQKTLEVFDPYNPHTYEQHISPSAQPGDIVFFNVLSPAGFYALDRTNTDPPWSYALTWDPVIEPEQRWQARLEQAERSHRRIWLVLYRGLAGHNGDLRGWMDSHLYPAQAEWGEEGVYYGLYGVRNQAMQTVSGLPVHWRAAYGFDMELTQAELPVTVRAGDIVPIALTWRADAPLRMNDKIFVHAFDARGQLVAQHDAQPLNDLRPMSTLPVGRNVLDHHGLVLPPGFTGQLQIEMGIYDPTTGQRLQTDQGRSTFTLARLDVER